MPAQTILVAEDDAAIRDLLTHHLERRARGGADLLVLDVGLAGVDGYDIARALRREERTLPIVMLTARSDEIDRVLGFELGADDYVCNPRSASKMRPHSTLRAPMPLVK
jgi:DNA-binding response OmpR family regulator